VNRAYKEAGVDVDAGYSAVALMSASVRSTYTEGVLGDIGGFGALFEPTLRGVSRPVLVSSTDGVGTKLQYALMADKHDTVGIDCVAMCVNDVICQGAAPLFFLDYIVCEKIIPALVAQIVSGVCEGCRRAKTALVGGETAEHPGCFPVGEYDLAGFCVGLAGYGNIIDGKKTKAGDLLLGVPSSGLHSNGFSLLRKLFPKPAPELLAEFLTPTLIYTDAVNTLTNTAIVNGIAHITGGGFIENIPRILPPGLRAVMEKPRSVPDIFTRVQKQGNISEEDMYNTFNMGFGLVVCVPPEYAGVCGYPVIGRVREGERGITLW
jgi:phosphoribosylformylglycinamidine cyclo-ligase